ncbi:unnamed protein product, partial [Nesidiocoris tenuis]
MSEELCKFCTGVHFSIAKTNLTIHRTISSYIGIHKNISASIRYCMMCSDTDQDCTIWPYRALSDDIGFGIGSDIKLG